MQDCDRGRLRDMLPLWQTRDIGKNSFLTGTKDGVPTREYDVAVCEDCYAVLKQKVETRNRLSD